MSRAGTPKARRMAAADQLLRLFGPRDGEQIPGGCDFCSAYQTVEPLRRGIWRLAVRHNADCPLYQQRQQRLKGTA